MSEAADVASLAIPGRNGIYLVPYIQTQPDLHYRLRVENLPEDAVVLVSLDPGSPDARTEEAPGPGFEGDFRDVRLGDHVLAAKILSAPEPVNRWGLYTRRTQLASTQLSRVARGDIVAAIGDSTTEGNGGPRFHFIPNWILAQRGAADWTSPDGRNFPQAGAFSRPEAPTSFTSTLGTLLSQQRQHPVLVLNDGYSGATTQSYKDISSSHDLAAEYAAARPNSWILNLGVNDPIIHSSPAAFDANIRAVLQNLSERFGARNADIHVACPTWSMDFRHDGVATYLPLIDRLRVDAGLGAAPDFFAYYRAKPSDLADAVHPNAQGYRDMASLWAQALAGQGSSCA
ncbi:MAG: hypothetical protein NVSMB17_07870 [Candidatus Dormibacteria bacterium]